ncbi:hypothetical protein Tpen_0350 [Thermofilum pendens Hrk 5]|uniref:Uncharacterized protein n=2 Tax=Thermofilum pendens TaxID=2269 RepID=A1RX29_THEPD|nr:hypothetical protein Tpen_0350 [Thermofilum pendens Hrk 5]
MQLLCSCSYAFPFPVHAKYLRRNVMARLMRGVVRSVGRLGYALVERVGIAGDGVEVEVEIPVRVLREAGLGLREGVEVVFEVAREAGSIDEWSVVMQGEVYLKKEGESAVYASLGGLQLVVKSPKIYNEFNVGDKVYFKLAPA